MASNNSTNMLLPIPVVGEESGPQYASDINNCMTIIDSHDHSAGSGVPITPPGLNISSDLTFAGNNATNFRSVRFSAQSSPLAAAADLGCLYESGVDLYYNDGAGNQVRITQSGGVAGSPGSIAGLASPASATYVSANQTFVWQSAASTPANLDAASVIFRKVSASSNGITMSVPSGIASNYTLTLPALPVSQKFMTLDSSGNIAAPWAVDNSTLEISTNTLQVKASGIGTTQIADQAVTQAKLAARATGTTVAAGGVAISTGCGSFSTSSLTYVNVTNLSVTITTTGRPVFIGLISDPTTPSSLSYIKVVSASSAASGNIKALRGSTDLNINQIAITTNEPASCSIEIPPSSFNFVDVVAAGTYTYKLQAELVSGSSIQIQSISFIAYEL